MSMSRLPEQGVGAQGSSNYRSPLMTLPALNRNSSSASAGNENVSFVFQDPYDRKYQTGSPEIATSHSRSSDHMYPTTSHSRSSDHMYPATSHSRSSDHMYPATSHSRSSDHMYPAKSHSSSSDHTYPATSHSSSSESTYQSGTPNLMTPESHSSHNALKRVRSNPTPLPDIAENVPSFNVATVANEPGQDTHFQEQREVVSSPPLNRSSHLDLPDPALPVYENVKPVSTSPTDSRLSPTNSSPVRSVKFKIGTSVSDSKLNSSSRSDPGQFYDVVEGQTSLQPRFEVTVHNEKYFTFTPHTMEGDISEVKVTEPTSPQGDISEVKVSEPTSPLGGVEMSSSCDSLDQPPFDPNLVCPSCGKRFREGEIQVFKRHAKACIKTSQ